LKINELAKISGVTVRTLHYYDEIGLLVPNEITESGYRIYDERSLSTLQQILFFRELDFPLVEIKEIMTNQHYDQNEALNKHKELLLQKRNRLEDLIKLVENTIKGDNIMSFKEFDTSKFEESKKKYANEVKERWGNTDAYKESEQKTASYDKNKWNFINGEGAEILKEFGKARNLSPDSNEAKELVQRWQEYISNNFYKCTDEILSGLGLMYVGDERFTENIDKNGKGTAKFMSDAIKSYIGNKN